MRAGLAPIALGLFAAWLGEPGGLAEMFGFALAAAGATQDALRLDDRPRRLAWAAAGLFGAGLALALAAFAMALAAGEPALLSRVAGAAGLGGLVAYGASLAAAR